MIKHWSIYRMEDGLFTGTTFASTIEGHHLLNVPEGHGAIEGHHDHLSKRVEGADENRRIVDWQPPSPSPDHEWDNGTSRWKLSAAAAEKQRKRLAAQARIRELEAAQHRRVRELLAQNDERLRAMDQEIEALRADL
jgi:hypothetical protein